MNYNFTQDWFTKNIPSLKEILGKDRCASKILEIGSFEGRSALWFLENVLRTDGHFTTVDPLRSFVNQEDVLVENINMGVLPTQTYRLIKNYSNRALPKLILDDEKFDIIYVDGDHTAPMVLSDAVMSFDLLEPNGIMVFDDYLWENAPGELKQPKIAIDSFVQVYAEKLTVISTNWQLAIKKNE